METPAGERPDTMNTYLEAPASLSLNAPRHSFDKLTDAGGPQLSQLCRALGLYVVSGRRRGDSLGRHTYSSAVGCSTVDYFITDLDPMSQSVLSHRS